MNKAVSFSHDSMANRVESLIDLTYSHCAVDFCPVNFVCYWKQKQRFYFQTWNPFLMCLYCYDCNCKFTANFAFSATNWPQYCPVMATKNLQH